jgi:hypothetical protein
VRCLRHALAVVIVVAATVTAAAHEIGTTQVTVHFDMPKLGEGWAYDVEVVTDADALLEKLEAVADHTGPKAKAGELAARLTALEDIFRDRVAFTVDGVIVHPAIDFTVTPPSNDVTPAVATIRLTGRLPPGAAGVVWKYAWTFASYALRLDRADDTHASSTEWLEGGQSSTPYAIGVAPAPVSRLTITWRYLWLGLTHIVPNGLDHMLFVLGLFLLNPRWRSVLWQVSAFTIAHSITLGLSMHGLITVPPAVVEPLIALSIIYVAVENLLRSELTPWRIGLVFVFGLLHGMGFAGVLTELGLPRAEFMTALVAFNAGVEAGQLLVIAAAFTLVGWYRAHPSYRMRVAVPASLAIACVAVYWTIERATFWR